MSTFISNASIYLAISEEAQAEAQRLDSSARTPKPDGSSGYVIAYDPSHRSYKQSLIAVAFAGIYLEALLYLRGTQLMGDLWLSKFDPKTYEVKLAKLGVTDQSLLLSAKRLRESRKDLVHEKAMPIGDLKTGNLRWAQKEAAVAIAFIRKVSLDSHLRGNDGLV